MNTSDAIPALVSKRKNLTQAMFRKSATNGSPFSVVQRSFSKPALTKSTQITAINPHWSKPLVQRNQSFSGPLKKIIADSKNILKCAAPQKAMPYFGPWRPVDMVHSGNGETPRAESNSGFLSAGMLIEPMSAKLPETETHEKPLPLLQKSEESDFRKRIAEAQAKRAAESQTQKLSKSDQIFSKTEEVRPQPQKSKSTTESAPPTVQRIFTPAPEETNPTTDPDVQLSKPEQNVSALAVKTETPLSEVKPELLTANAEIHPPLTKPAEQIAKISASQHADAKKSIPTNVNLPAPQNTIINMELPASTNQPTLQKAEEKKAIPVITNQPTSQRAEEKKEIPASTNQPALQKAEEKKATPANPSRPTPYKQNRTATPQYAIQRQITADQTPIKQAHRKAHTIAKVKTPLPNAKVNQNTHPTARLQRKFVAPKPNEIPTPIATAQRTIENFVSPQQPDVKPANPSARLIQPSLTSVNATPHTPRKKAFPAILNPKTALAFPVLKQTPEIMSITLDGKRAVTNHATLQAQSIQMQSFTNEKNQKPSRLAQAHQTAKPRTTSQLAQATVQRSNKTENAKSHPSVPSQTVQRTSAENHPISAPRTETKDIQRISAPQTVPNSTPIWQPNVPLPQAEPFSPMHTVQKKSEPVQHSQQTSAPQPFADSQAAPNNTQTLSSTNADFFKPPEIPSDLWEQMTAPLRMNKPQTSTEQPDSPRTQKFTKMRSETETVVPELAPANAAMIQRSYDPFDIIEEKVENFLSTDSDQNHIPQDLSDDDLDALADSLLPRIKFALSIESERTAFFG